LRVSTRKLRAWDAHSSAIAILSSGVSKLRCSRHPIKDAACWSFSTAREAGTRVKCPKRKRKAQTPAAKVEEFKKKNTKKQTAKAMTSSCGWHRGRLCRAAVALLPLVLWAQPALGGLMDVTSPSAGRTVAAGQPMTISWDVGAGSDPAHTLSIVIVACANPTMDVRTAPLPTPCPTCAHLSLVLKTEASMHHAASAHWGVLPDLAPAHACCVPFGSLGGFFIFP
jgi:hypothetical protein